jgi:hypothetical protein
LKEIKVKDALVLKIVSWAIAASVVGVVGLYLVGGPQAFKNPTVREILATADDVNPLEDMAGLCSNHRCVEGWRTDVGNFVRFERLGQAEYWSIVIGDDCRRVGRVLVDFTDLNLTTEQKKRAVDIISQGKDWF